MAKKNNEIPVVITFREMRIAVGILGIALPFILILPGLFLSDIGGVLPTISAYYYSSMRGVMTGILFAISFFLICYKGYDAWDNWSTNTAGVMCALIALIPEFNAIAPWSCIIDKNVSDLIHSASAGISFIILGLISLFLFTRTHEGKKIKTHGTKAWKNILFRTAGVIIIAMALTLLALHFTPMKSSVINIVCETVMLVSFGVSWLVKGVF
ncbi:MAG: hypothetical protein ABSG94_11395 [Brevinematales bacterium]|jgi:hypothetical protein